jgi:hypothetical protein
MSTQSYIPESPGILIIIGLVAGFLFLILLLILATIWARRRQELARFAAHVVEADRDAERERNSIEKNLTIC